MILQYPHKIYILTITIKLPVLFALIIPLGGYLCHDGVIPDPDSGLLF